MNSNTQALDFFSFLQFLRENSSPQDTQSRRAIDFESFIANAFSESDVKPPVQSKKQTQPDSSTEEPRVRVQPVLSIPSLSPSKEQSKQHTVSFTANSKEQVRKQFIETIADLTLHSIGSCIDKAEDILSSGRLHDVIGSIKEKLAGANKVLILVTDSRGSRFVPTSDVPELALRERVFEIFNQLTGNKFKGNESSFNMGSSLHLRAGNVEVRVVRAE